MNQMTQESYGKFYAKTFTGSMMKAGAPVFALMGYCVANAKPPDGEVEINVELVATMIGEPPAVIQKALDYLTAEDPKSRSPDENGKRLVKTGAFSYRLVNWLAHRDGIDIETRQLYWRNKQAEYREKQKKLVAESNGAAPKKKRGRGKAKPSPGPMTRREGEADRGQAGGPNGDAPRETEATDEMMATQPWKESEKGSNHPEPGRHLAGDQPADAAAL